MNNESRYLAQLAGPLIGSGFAGQLAAAQQRNMFGAQAQAMSGLQGSVYAAQCGQQQGMSLLALEMSRSARTIIERYKNKGRVSSYSSKTESNEDYEYLVI